MRQPGLRATVLLAWALGLLLPACVRPPGPVYASTYDLVLSESDSGSAGVSTGEGVAFVLDRRRNHLWTSPRLDFKTDDAANQFRGKHLFALPPGKWGVFDVTATGAGMAPFTYHLVVGVLAPRSYWSPLSVLHVGDIVVQQWGGGGGCVSEPPQALVTPTFELLQSGVLAPSLQFGLTRRAYRAVRLGSQTVSVDEPPTASPYRQYKIVVANLASSFNAIVNGSAPFGRPNGLLAGAGDKFVVVLMGDAQQASWSVEPAGGIVRLPDSEAGPQPPGATLIPFKVLADGDFKLTLNIGPTIVSLPVSNTWSPDDGRELVATEPDGLCLPTNFPRYPLMHATAITVRTVDPLFGPTYTTPCSWDLASNGSPADVLAFYSSELDQNAWKIISKKGGTITFKQRTLGNPPTGTLVVLAGGNSRVSWCAITTGTVG
jgi:hypothetical protein